MSEIDELRKELRDSQEKQNAINEKLVALLTSLTAPKPTTNIEISPVIKKTEHVTAMVHEKDYTDLKNPKQPRPDSVIRVQSLTKGELCLNANGRTIIKFDKYGDIKPVLYSELMTIVNNNRSFAEDGSFFILDDCAIYYLGLGDFYNKILSYDKIASLESYDDETLRQILPKIPDSQKDVIALIYSGKIFNDEQVDRNKIDVIGRACGIDIIGKAREMQEIADNMTK